MKKEYKKERKRKRRGANTAATEYAATKRGKGYLRVLFRECDRGRHSRPSKFDRPSCSSRWCGYTLNSGGFYFRPALPHRSRFSGLIGSLVSVTGRRETVGTTMAARTHHSRGHE